MDGGNLNFKDFRITHNIGVWADSKMESIYPSENQIGVSVLLPALQSNISGKLFLWMYC